MHGLRVHVETRILDYFRQLTFPVSYHVNAVKIYRDTKNTIIHSLRTNLCEMWEGLCLFNVRFSSSKVTPTVIVYVKPLSFFDWSSLRSEHLILTSGDPEIDVSFRPGVFKTTMDSGSPGLGTQQAVKSIKPGTSIGVKGISSSGSLGSYFDLKFGGKIHQSFLTNYHVLAPSSHEIRKKADMFGSSPAIDDETRSEIVAPSQEDVNREIFLLNGHLETLKAKKTHLEGEKILV